MINTQYINYESDFTLLFRFKGGRPEYAWEVVFLTHPSRANYVASFDGTTYKNCYPVADSDAVLIIFNSHQLGRGVLRYRLREALPDKLFPDGFRNTITPQDTNIRLWEGESSDAALPPEVVAELMPMLKGRDGAGTLTLDLTQLTYPAEGRKVAEEIAKGQPVSILIRVSSGVPARAVVQIEDTGVTYKLYTGSFEQSTTGERVSLHQLCYVLNKTEGTVKVEQCKLTTDLATADSVADCVKKKDILILNSNLTNI